MLTQVDKSENFLVQKITNFDRTQIVRFQTVPIDKVGDSNEVQCFGTLQGAREAVGIGQPRVVAADKPSAKARKAAKATKASAASDASRVKKTGKASKTKKAA